MFSRETNVQSTGYQDNTIKKQELSHVTLECVGTIDTFIKL